ncbi:MAG TPA: Hsp20/alpha crystallin family protein [Chitinophagales bacterium]|nr:Hsp20/alpha crystallin family protein [Chitinophagales bacterium]
MTTTLKRSGEPNVFSPLPGLQSFFTDPFLRNWFNWDNDTAVEDSTLPAVNIGETENTYELAVAAPGMNKNDFKVELENNRLVIKGERKTEKENQQGHNWLRKEYNYTSFQRSFTLAESQVNAEGVKAKYSDGILHISIPKSAEAKNKRARIIQIS